ncbi:MAG: hypothetical protein ABI127_03725 [Dokdonella sp.]
MNREETGNLFALARRMESTPRHVLIRAACMAEHEMTDVGEILQRIRQTGVRYCPLVDGCANLLLTPVASYAHDTLDNALELLWQDTRAGE